MREDLRYIENLIADIDYSSHPSDRKLADFIDNKLIDDAKNEVMEHLAHCYSCREVVHEVIEYKKKPRFINNIILGTPLVALVASIMVFVYMPSDILVGEIDLSKSYIEYRDVEAKKIAKIIDGDEVLSQIIKSTDIGYLKTFDEAQKEKDFDMALDIYQEAINSIPEDLDERERLKETIVIHSVILKRAIAEDKSRVIKNYKQLLIEEIKNYYLEVMQ